MGRPRSDAPERLIAVTSTLVRERGVHATGLKDIARAASVPMGSLYFHFPAGKNELVVAALRASGDLVTAVVADFFTRAPNARQAVHDFIEFMGTSLEQTRFTQGCPVATVGLELGAEDDAVATVIDHAFSSWSAIVEQHLQADGYPNAKSMAMLVVSALEGGLLLSRVRRSIAPLQDVAAAIDDMLRRSTSSSGHRSRGGAK